MDTYRIPWLPSIMTGFGGVASYLEDTEDVDFFLVKAVGSSQICIVSPPGDYAPYEFDVSNRSNPHFPAWESLVSLPANEDPLRKCVTPKEVPLLAEKMTPPNFETDTEIGFFVIRVFSTAPPNSDRPYWIETPGITVETPGDNG